MLAVFGSIWHRNRLSLLNIMGTIALNIHKNLTVYFNGEFLPWDEALVHVFSPAVKYGAGVFEGICAYMSKKGMNIFRLEEHLARLEYSQRMMRFERIFTKEEVAEPLKELVRRNKFKETVHIRPTVYVDGLGEPSALGPIGISITAVHRPRPKIRIP